MEKIILDKETIKKIIAIQENKKLLDCSLIEKNAYILDKTTINEIKELITEKLPLSTAKKYSNIKRTKVVKNLLDVFFEDLKNQSQDYYTNNSGDRIYIPFNISQNKENKENNNQIELEVTNALQDNGFKVIDYKKGIAINQKNNQQIGIGKVLNKIGDSNLLNKFASDTNRDLSKKNKGYIVFSKHPYDIAGMSTDRGWTSCMNLTDGEKKQYVKCDIKEGTIITYLIVENDKNINNPIARLLIKPFADEYGNVIFKAEKAIYGTGNEEFKKTVEKLLHNINDYEINKTYTLNKNLYVDNPNIKYTHRLTIDELKQLTPEERLKYATKISNNLSFFILKDEKYILLNQNGEIANEDLFAPISTTNFSEGLLKVQIIGKGYYFVDENGKYFDDKNKQWYKAASTFKDGIAVVETNDNGYNYINTSNQILFPDKKFQFAGQFKNGIAEVEYQDKFIKINDKGEFI